MTLTTLPPTSACKWKMKWVSSNTQSSLKIRKAFVENHQKHKMAFEASIFCSYSTTVITQQTYNLLKSGQEASISWSSNKEESQSNKKDKNSVFHFGVFSRLWNKRKLIFWHQTRVLYTVLGPSKPPAKFINWIKIQLFINDRSLPPVITFFHVHLEGYTLLQIFEIA